MFLRLLHLWPLFVAVLAVGVIAWQRTQLQALRRQLRQMDRANRPDLDGFNPDCPTCNE